MSFVTTLRLQSGDRAALEGVIEDIRETANQKGAELNGPHSFPPEQLSVPIYADTSGDRVLDTWTYTVYRREIELVGHEALAREITAWELPEAVRLEAEVTSVHP